MIQGMVAERANCMDQPLQKIVERCRALVGLALSIEFTNSAIERQGVMDNLGNDPALDVATPRASPHARHGQGGRQPKLSKPVTQPKFAPFLGALEPCAQPLSQRAGQALLADNGESVTVRQFDFHFHDPAALRVLQRNCLGGTRIAAVKGLQRLLQVRRGDGKLVSTAHNPVPAGGQLANDEVRSEGGKGSVRGAA